MSPHARHFLRHCRLSSWDQFPSSWSASFSVGLIVLRAPSFVLWFWTITNCSALYRKVHRQKRQNNYKVNTRPPFVPLWPRPSSSPFMLITPLLFSVAPPVCTSVLLEISFACFWTSCRWDHRVCSGVSLPCLYSSAKLLRVVAVHAFWLPRWILSYQHY